MKRRLKKNVIVYGLLLIIICIIFFMLFFNSAKNKSYNLEYKIDDYEINENYDNKEKIYYYEIKKDGITYPFLENSNKLKEKKLIKEIETYDKDDIICLKVSSNTFKDKLLCSKDNELIDYHLLKEELVSEYPSFFKENNTEYKDNNNYKVYNLFEELYIWNYKRFEVLNSKNKMENIFNKDIYSIPLSIKINNYILVADYSNEYYFDKVYLIDLSKNLKTKTWKLKYKISFDSYIAGINDKSIYIVDEKEKKEYELVPHKEKMRIVANTNKLGTIYKNGEETKVSLTKMIKNKTKFTYKNNYQYKIEDKTLFLSYLDNKQRIKISNKKVDRIVNINKDIIYYISKDSLYRYSIEDGEVLILTYNELEFNDNLSIFIN